MQYNHICQTCKKEFVNNDLRKPNKFCSKKCYGLSRRNKPHMYGYKISIAKIGHGWPAGFSERQSIAQKKRFEHETPWNKGMTCGERRNRDNENEWSKNEEWRKGVFERDNYACVRCGARNGNGKKVVLNADHIKMWALYPELRYVLSNGQTLCEKCHKEKTSSELKKYWINQFKKSKHYTL